MLFEGTVPLYMQKLELVLSNCSACVLNTFTVYFLFLMLTSCFVLSITAGPSFFLPCPLHLPPHDLEQWFVTQWNHFIAPYMKSTVMAGVEVGWYLRVVHGRLLTGGIWCGVDSWCFGITWSMAGVEVVDSLIYSSPYLRV